MGDGYSALPLGGVVTECPKKDPPPEYWVEFELISEDGTPVAWEEYRVELPDRTTPATGLLDAFGWVRIEKIMAQGTCKIYFPYLDEAACTFIESSAPRGPAGEVRGRGRDNGLTGGPGEHSAQVRAGQCCSSLAYVEGHVWSTIWNAPQNASLQVDGRDDPNCLVEGENIHIPAIKEFHAEGNTEQRHRVQFKGSSKLVLRILYSDQSPRARVRCTLTVEGKTLPASTDSNGKVTFAIHPLATECSLNVPGDSVVAEQNLTLKCGSLAPHSSLRGVQQRLRNLGTWEVPVDGKDEGKTQAAVSFLQGVQRLPRTGAIAQNVWDPLRNQHGS